MKPDPATVSSESAGAPKSVPYDSVAGLVHALERGEGLEAAVRLGVAAGTATVLTEGTQLCRRVDVLRLHEAIVMRRL